MRGLAPEGGQPREVASVVNQIIRGGSNANGTVTLTPGAATTVVDKVGMGDQATILFSPMTANAALEQAAGTMFVSAIGPETFTITHANNAQADRTFRYLAIGG